MATRNAQWYTPSQMERRKDMKFDIWGWLALVGASIVGLGLLVTRVMGQQYSSSLYIRAGIVLPIVFFYGLARVLTRRRRTDNA